MIKRRVFRNVQIQSPDCLRALCGILQTIDGVVRLATLGIISTWFSARVSLLILRRDVNRSRTKRGLPPYQPFQKRHPITEEPEEADNTKRQKLKCPKCGTVVTMPSDWGDNPDYPDKSDELLCDMCAEGAE